MSRTGPAAEEPFFFESDGAQLFGMLHLPPGDGGAGARPGVGLGLVFCAGFAEEDFRTHRELVVYARRLAQEGFAVLRFDYRGCGDSAGRFEDFGVPARVADVRRAVDVLRERSGVARTGLLGLRFGATLAAAAAADDDRVEYLVLWAPIVPANQYVKMLQMSQMTHELANFGRVVSNRKAVAERLAAGGALDLAGNLLTHAVHRELQSFDPWRATTRSPTHVLIVGIAGDTTRAADLAALQGRYPGSELIVIKEKLFWFDKVYQNPSTLYETTSRWLERVALSDRR